MLKSKGNNAQAFFFSFADVSSYLTFKFCAWKRGCTISFELQVTQTLLNIFWKGLTKFYSEKQELQPYDGSYILYVPLNFSTIFTLKVL